MHLYSREFSDSRLPPRYGGTAFRERHRPPPCKEEGPPPREEKRRSCEEEGAPGENAPPPRPCEERGHEPPSLLDRLLPGGVELEDLLLLGLALLFLADGCDDDYLPLILLFLFIIR